MHGVPEGLVFCLLVCSYFWLVNSKTHPMDSSHRSRFAHQVREIRSHRDTRQAHLNPPSETKCNYTIALLDFPPYIMNSTVEEGFMYDKIKWFVDFTCFTREENDAEACKMLPIYVSSWKDIVDLIKKKKVDFAFPIQADAKAELKDEPEVTLIRAFVSSGVSMIVNTKQCEEESREQLFTSITSQWPILACIMLLSGISGVVIWLLVRSYCYFLFLLHESVQQFYETRGLNGHSCVFREINFMIGSCERSYSLLPSGARQVARKRCW